MIQIKATTVTPLCQIRNSEDEVVNQKKITVIKPMKQKVMLANSKGTLTSFETPIYSGNGFRGKLRRAALEIMLEKAKNDNIKISTMDFHLMNAGGGNLFQAQSFETIKEVRGINPLVSLFGASLAIPGKIITPNLMPYRSITDVLEYYTHETEEGHVFSTIITSDKNRDQFITSDDMLLGKGNARFVTEEQIIEWELMAGENQTARAKARNSEDTDTKKVKKETMKSFLSRDYVIRGVDFYTGLRPMPTCEFTTLEYGMLIRALERVVVTNLGSNVARNFGLMKYAIDFHGGSELETDINAYGEAKIVKLNYKGLEKEAVECFDAWLENDFSQETLEISQKLKN